LPPPPARGKAAVSVEPLGELRAAPAVLRLRVAGASGRSPLADFRLFAGQLSSYYLHRIADRTLPSTLLDREVPVVAWSEEADVVVAPVGVLPSGAFSLATPELGLVAEVHVDATLLPWLERRWPPHDETTGGALSVFCGSAAAGAREDDVGLEPSGAAAAVRLGLDESGLFGDECVRLEVPEGTAGALSLPPLMSGTVALEPLPLVAPPENEAPDDTRSACGTGEVAVGTACITLDDDRFSIRTEGAPSLWALAAPAAVLSVVAPGASLVVRGLEPQSTVELLGARFETSGRRNAVEATLTLAPRHPHVVINEVLANPAGPDATGEWIELANDADEPVALDGFELQDAGGVVTLPAARLEPRELVLLVGPDFAPDPTLDVLPAAGTRVVRLAELGRAGLSNAGESLRLRDATGRLLSLFPSAPARKAGVSMARRAPDALDEDASAFGEHAAPGASPGAPNVLVAP
jgi:hypothetical protein